LNWQFSAASHSKWSKADIDKVYRNIKAIGEVGYEIQSVYETVGNEDRINMIGSAVQDGGQSWIDSHPVQIEWLKSIGLTPQAAEQQFKDWIGNARSKFHHPE